MIFIDRSIPRPVAEALQKVRSDVEWLEPRFRHDAKEEEWLQFVGQAGWQSPETRRFAHVPGREEHSSSTTWAVSIFTKNSRSPGGTI